VLNKKKSINSEPTAQHMLQHGRMNQFLLDDIEECQLSIMLV